MHYLSVRNIWGIVALVGILSIPQLLFAQEPGYVPLVGIPGIENPQTTRPYDYINALFILTITFGALIAVVRIGIAGVKYMTSEVVTSKESAKDDIKGALLGLGILLSVFIVLNTIYPNLTNLDILKNANRIIIDTSSNEDRSPESCDPITDDTHCVGPGQSYSIIPCEGDCVQESLECQRKTDGRPYEDRENNQIVCIFTDATEQGGTCTYGGDTERSATDCARGCVDNGQYPIFGDDNTTVTCTTPSATYGNSNSPPSTSPLWDDWYDNCIDGGGTYHDVRDSGLIGSSVRDLGYTAICIGGNPAALDDDNNDDNDDQDPPPGEGPPPEDECPEPQYYTGLPRPNNCAERPKCEEFNATPTAVPQDGGSVTFSWSASNATEVCFEGPGINNTCGPNTTGSVTISASPGQYTAYALGEREWTLYGGGSRSEVRDNCTPIIITVTP